ncbi:MAG: glycosyltransferase family 1 protein [Candidatus Shapirobacteria bacterium]|jgi:glycosyltransferase involved in cell wall biosynthesis
MLIGIDGNEANQPIRAGVGQYAFHILCNLAKLDQQNQYLIYLKDQPLSDMPKTSKNWHYLVFGPKKLWTKFALPVYLFTHFPRPNVFFSPNQYSPIFSPCPTIPTVHDIGYLTYPEQFTKKDLFQLTYWTKASIFRAKYIVAVSEFTKNELIKTYHLDPQKISIVYNGVDSPPITDYRLPITKFKINQPFFLSVGTLKPNKNIPYILEAFSLFLTKQPNYQLVIAGKKGWLFDEIFSTVKKLKLESKVIFTDYISENEKWWLYTQARATLIPSLYEGFGIPAIESQRVSTPVIASNIESLKEILDKSALFVDPKNYFDLAKKMHEIINPKVRKELITAGLSQSQKFTWTNSAKTLINLFNQL